MDYPEFCDKCSMVEKCKQKTFMLPNTEPVQGYVACADTWCKEHCPKTDDAESMSYYPENDTPLHCAECGRPLQCSLTDFGVDYIKEHLEVHGFGCCRELWPVLFAESLP